MVVAGSIVAAATATLGPPGTVAAAFLSPIAAEMFDRAVDEWRAEGSRKAGILLSSAAEGSGKSLEWLLGELSDHPAKLALLAQAMNAAVQTTLEDKLYVLGSSLASGALADDIALVDETRLRLVALAEIDGPHLRVLAHVASRTRQDGEGTWLGASESEIADGLGESQRPRTSGVLQPILRTLDRNGLIFQAGIGEVWDENLADDIRPRAGTNEWGLTLFGRSILSDFQDAKPPKR